MLTDSAMAPTLSVYHDRYSVPTAATKLRLRIKGLLITNKRGLLELEFHFDRLLYAYVWREVVTKHSIDSTTEELESSAQPWPAVQLMRVCI